MRRWLLWWCASCLCVVPFAAHAQPQAPVRFAGCNTLDVPATARLLALELRSLQQAPAASLTITCSEDEMVVIAAAGANHTQSRTLQLAGVEAKAKPRILALAAAELLMASPPPEAPAPAPPPAVQLVVAQAEPEAAREVSAEATRPRVEAGGFVRWLPSLTYGTAGAHLALLSAGWPAGRRFRLALKAKATWESGEQQLDYGTGHATAWSLGAGAVLRGRLDDAGRWQPWLGVGVQAGWAFIRADASSDRALGSAFSAPFAGPVAEVGLACALSPRWSLAGGVDVGHVVAKAAGQGAVAGSARFGFAGAWLAPHLSLAFHL